MGMQQVDIPQVYGLPQDDEDILVDTEEEVADTESTPILMFKLTPVMVVCHIAPPCFQMLSHNMPDFLNIESPTEYGFFAAFHLIALGVYFAIVLAPRFSYGAGMSVQVVGTIVAPSLYGYFYSTKTPDLGMPVTLLFLLVMLIVLGPRRKQ